MHIYMCLKSVCVCVPYVLMLAALNVSFSVCCESFVFVLVAFEAITYQLTDGWLFLLDFCCFFT